MPEAGPTIERWSHCLDQLESSERFTNFTSEATRLWQEAELWMRLRSVWATRGGTGDVDWISTLVRAYHAPRTWDTSCSHAVRPSWKLKIRSTSTPKEVLKNSRYASLYQARFNTNCTQMQQMIAAYKHDPRSIVCICTKSTLLRSERSEVEW